MPLQPLLIATRNPGKMREYRGLLGDVPFDLVSLDDLGIEQEVEETGHTFRDNAVLKAQTYGALGGVLTLADDSGLEVDALGGQPGIYSSRYGREPAPPSVADAGSDEGPASDQDRVALLLRNLDGVPWERRTARFRCVLAIAAPPGCAELGTDRTELSTIVGSVAGMIQYEPRGSEGFGYDPVFYLPSYGMTMAQLPLDEKNRISHRAGAAGRAAKLLHSRAKSSAQRTQ